MRNYCMCVYQLEEIMVLLGEGELSEVGRNTVEVK